MSKEKSRKLKNIFSSRRSDSDLQNFSKSNYQKIIDELTVINSNVLYLTYRIDKISATQKTLDADDYYSDKEVEEMDNASDNSPSS